MNGYGDIEARDYDPEEYLFSDGWRKPTPEELKAIKLQEKYEFEQTDRRFSRKFRLQGKEKF